MRAALTLVTVAAALPAVFADYWDGTPCSYQGQDQKTICDDARTAILYCNPDGHWRNGYTAMAAAATSLLLLSRARPATPSAAAKAGDGRVSKSRNLA